MDTRIRFSFVVGAGLCALAGLWQTAEAAVIQTRINVDNYAAVFSGNAAGTSLTMHQFNVVGPLVGLPNSNTFNTTDPYLYVAAWSDDGVQQGLLIDVMVDSSLTQSGDPAWDVFASGIDMDSPGAPSIATMSAQIAIANGGGGPSLGWVAPAIGGTNTGTFPASNPWAAVGVIQSSSQWMWYDSGKDTFSAGFGLSVPFQVGFNHDEFLIFRLPVPEPASAALLVIGGLAVGCRTRKAG